MANEFHYCVGLSIVHASIDPKRITEAITELRPKIESMAGTERRARDGRPAIPRRTAQLSHWLAELHDEKKIYSGDRDIGEFILERLTDIDVQRHQSLFAEIRKEGRVQLSIGWFSESNHSATLLSADLLKKCGELGIDIELNFYGPDVSPPSS